MGPVSPRAPSALGYWLKGCLLEVLRRLGARRFGEPRGMPGRVPQVVVGQMAALQSFAPELAAGAVLPQARRVQPQWGPSPATAAWARLAAMVRPGATFVVVADDPAALPPAWRGVAGGITIRTGPGAAKWPEVAFGEACGSLPVALRGILLGRLLVELGAPDVAIGPGEAGLAALSQTAAGLVSRSSVQVMLPPPGPRPGPFEGLLSGPFPSALIFTAASEATLAYWRLRFGLDEARCRWPGAPRSQG